MICHTYRFRGSKQSAGILFAPSGRRTINVKSLPLNKISGKTCHTQKLTRGKYYVLPKDYLRHLSSPSLSSWRRSVATCPQGLKQTLGVLASNQKALYWIREDTTCSWEDQATVTSSLERQTAKWHELMTSGINCNGDKIGSRLVCNNITRCNKYQMRKNTGNFRRSANDYSNRRHVPVKRSIDQHCKSRKFYVHGLSRVRLGSY